MAMNRNYNYRYGGRTTPLGNNEAYIMNDIEATHLIYSNAVVNLNGNCKNIFYIYEDSFEKLYQSMLDITTIETSLSSAITSMNTRAQRQLIEQQNFLKNNIKNIQSRILGACRNMRLPYEDYITIHNLVHSSNIKLIKSKSEILGFITKHDGNYNLQGIEVCIRKNTEGNSLENQLNHFGKVIASSPLQRNLCVVMLTMLKIPGNYDDVEAASEAIKETITKLYSNEQGDIVETLLETACNTVLYDTTPLTLYQSYKSQNYTVTPEYMARQLVPNVQPEMHPVQQNLLNEIGPQALKKLNDIYTLGIQKEWMPDDQTTVDNEWWHYKERMELFGKGPFTKQVDKLCKVIASMKPSESRAALIEAINKELQIKLAYEDFHLLSIEIKNQPGRKLLQLCKQEIQRKEIKLQEKEMELYGRKAELIELQWKKIEWQGEEIKRQESKLTKKYIELEWKKLDLKLKEFEPQWKELDLEWDKLKPQWDELDTKWKELKLEGRDFEPEWEKLEKKRHEIERNRSLLEKSILETYPDKSRDGESPDRVEMLLQKIGNTSALALYKGMGVESTESKEQESKSHLLTKMPNALEVIPEEEEKGDNFQTMILNERGSEPRLG